MRNDSGKWPAFGGLDGDFEMTAPGLRVRSLEVVRQTVLSGSLDACLATCNLRAAFAGGLDVAVGESYAVRQRRDRILCINGPQIQDGWHDKHGVAVSDMTSAYVILEMSGTLSEPLISTGTEFYAERTSPSVSRLWHGYGVLLYRHTDHDTYRMHIRTANLAAVWEMIERQVQALQRLKPDAVLAQNIAARTSRANIERENMA